jgi:hypothetical protein
MAGLQSFSGDCSADQDAVHQQSCTDQHVGVLSTLASLGMKEGVQQAVTQVLSRLERSGAHGCTSPALKPAQSGKTAHTQTSLAARRPTKELQLSQPLQKRKVTLKEREGKGPRPQETDSGDMTELEQKLALSRSIMRKLYHRNLELEKELLVCGGNTWGLPPVT